MLGIRRNFSSKFLPKIILPSLRILEFYLNLNYFLFFYKITFRQGLFLQSKNIPSNSSIQKKKKINSMNYLALMYFALYSKFRSLEKRRIRGKKPIKLAFFQSKGKFVSSAHLSLSLTFRREMEIHVAFRSNIPIIYLELTDATSVYAIL